MMYSADEIRFASEKLAIEMVRANIEENDKWLIRGLLAIYRRQTADEQTSEQTKHDNGIGFNGLDATILSSFAKQVLSWEASAVKRFASPLSPKQVGLARRKMKKYAGQLARIAQAS
jgi:hypothetical protein